MVSYGYVWRVVVVFGAGRVLKSSVRKDMRARIPASGINKINEARRHTLDELIEQYRVHVLPQYGRLEQAKRGAKLRWWSDRLGARFLGDITPARIAEAKTSLAAGVGRSKRGADHYLDAINAPRKAFMPSREAATSPSSCIPMPFCRSSSTASCRGPPSRRHRSRYLVQFWLQAPNSSKQMRRQVPLPRQPARHSS